MRLRAWLFHRPWCQGAFRLADCRDRVQAGSLRPHLFLGKQFSLFPFLAPQHAHLFNGTVCWGGVPAPVPV